MKSEDVKQLFSNIRYTLKSNLYNECMKDYNDYYESNNLSRLPKIGKDSELYDKQHIQAQSLYDECYGEYEQKLETLTSILDNVSNELEHRLWFYEMDELNQP